MLDVAVILVLGVHLICVNVASAGPLVCVWYEWREGRGDATAGKDGRALARASLLLFLVGMLLGIGLAYLAWDRGFGAAIERVPAKIFWGMLELLFSLVLLIVHPLWWKIARQPSAGHRFIRALCPILSGTNLLYHFSFLFVIIAALGNGNAAAGTISSAEFRGMMLAGPVLSRSLHFILASFAVTGVAMMVMGIRRSDETHEKPTRHMLAGGGRIALVATLLQIPVGIWIVSQMPRGAMRDLMGRDAVATSLFLVSLLFAFGLLHKLAVAAMGQATRRTVLQSAAIMILVIVSMTAVLKRSQPINEPISAHGSTSARFASDNISPLHSMENP